MDQTDRLCSECGRPARVRILENYVAGQPIIKHFCFSCADRRFGDAPGDEPTHRQSVGSLMVIAGLTICLISLLGDHLGLLGLHGDEGFGWYRQSGCVAGVLLVCLGAFWQVDILGVVGSILLVLALSAKMLHLAGTGGFGWKHQFALAAGLILIVTGVLVRQLYYRHLARRPTSSNPPLQAGSPVDRPPLSAHESPARNPQPPSTRHDTLAPRM